MGIVRSRCCGGPVFTCSSLSLLGFGHSSFGDFADNFMDIVSPFFFVVTSIPITDRLIPYTLSTEVWGRFSVCEFYCVGRLETC